MVNRAIAKPERLRLATDERRAQLLALGRRLFDERAYDEISIDDIAAAAGISKGLLYHYFPSKRVFYVETVRSAAAEMLSLTEVPRDLPPEERATRALDAFLDYVARHRKAWVALMRGGVGTDPEVAAIVDQTRAALAKRILEQGLGLASPPPRVRLAVRGFIGFVEAASLDWLDHGDVDRVTLRDTLLHAVADALARAMTSGS